MGKTASELWREGHKKVVCVNNHQCHWWTEGNVYEFTSEGMLIDDDGDYSDAGGVKFEPYTFFGMGNKEFTNDEMNQLAQMVAEKVIAILKEKMNATR